MIEATESGVACRRRASRSESAVPAPSLIRSSTAPRPSSGSITQICRTSGAPPMPELVAPLRAASTVAASTVFSAKTATAPESARIHSTCSAEDVS